VEEVKQKIDQVQRGVDLRAEITGEERFISAVATVAILGGVIAKSLGLIAFDIAPIISWATGAITGMRTSKKDLSGDTAGVLGQFLDEHVGNRLLVKHGPRSNTWLVVDPPKGQLVMRHEVDTGRLFISRAAFKTWLAKKLGSYTQVKNELKTRGVLISDGGRKNLGVGTYFAGASQAVFEIDGHHEALGRMLGDRGQPKMIAEDTATGGTNEDNG
jgi:hypothetical protein